MLLFTIAGYCYPEIDIFLGENTQKSADFRVSLPGNRHEKTLISSLSLRKQKYFRNYFRV